MTSSNRLCQDRTDIHTMQSLAFLEVARLWNRVGDYDPIQRRLGNLFERRSGKDAVRDECNDGFRTGFDEVFGSHC